jgi:beta-glucosidase
MTDSIETLLSQMTLEEKATLLAGADLWHTVPLPRLGIPVLKVTDGPVGARGVGGSSGPASACFPCGTALAATWDTDLVQQVGQALAEETQAKGAHILLAPTVNIHRSPLAGRNFECYSEDPYLTSRMAVAYIQGLQSKGVGACVKHFVCNDSEFERQSISSEVGERALREIYLPPFQAAVCEAGAWALMSAYNRLNGVYCSENRRLLLDILKGEWGFDGLVISDWHGTYSQNAAAGGLDLEMPGPGNWLGAEQVLDLLRSGQVSEAQIDDKVRRLLLTLQRVGALDGAGLQPEEALDRPEHRGLIRRAGAEAVVLLKNSAGVLPLDPSRLASLAVIGFNVRHPQVLGGGSAEVTPHTIVTPLDGIRNAAGQGVDVAYAPGVAANRQVLLLDSDWLSAGDGRHGLEVALFDNLDLSGSPSGAWFSERTNITWVDPYLNGVNPQRFSARLSSRLVPPRNGRYRFSLSGSGLYRLALDGQYLVQIWAQDRQDVAPGELGENQAEIDLQAGRSYELVIEYAWEGQSPWRLLRIGCQLLPEGDWLAEAVALAARSQVAVVFAGLTHEWESEGFDRLDMDLPAAQNELIEQIANANPHTVVVLNSGSPVRMPWLEKVAAVLQMWYPGQEAGNAIADVLFGAVDACGRLPTTFPRRLEDTPAFINYPGENGRVNYGEGIYVGYRYYDQKDVESLFPFGFGLSYTSFAYRDLRLDAETYGPGDKIQASLEVHNTGPRPGKEVVQLYVRDVQASLARPPKELKAFAKVALQPGEARRVTLTLDETALAFYDDARQAWVAEPGEFEVLVGSSSRHIHCTARFTWHGSPGIAAHLSIHLPLRHLLADASAKAVLYRHFGALVDHPMLEMALDMKLEEIAAYIPDVLTAAKLQQIDDDLARATN